MTRRRWPVALSGPLFQMQDNGEIDLVLAKRRLGETRGALLHREPLVWLARDPDHALMQAPLPLMTWYGGSASARYRRGWCGWKPRCFPVVSWMVT